MENDGAAEMRICLFSPYIPKHTGGGERYLFDVAIALAKDHQVYIAIPNNQQFSTTEVRQKYQQFLGESLEGISLISTPLGTNASFLSKLWWTKQWDVLYYLTDGSLFFSLAKRNIVHIQFPFKLDKSSIMDRLKLANWQVKNTNSTFTKKIVEISWPVTIDEVHHPQISQVLSQTKVEKVVENKQKVIINVGRFFRQLHCKKQDVLVEIFQQMEQLHPKQTKGWKLILIGSVEDQSYADEVAAKVSSKNIEIIHDITRDKLLEMYQNASIYWHATGYDVDQDKFPTKVEHFGISTGEAMSFGCAPVVINKGGQPEVVGKELSQYLWQTKEECIAQTISLLANPNELTKAQLTAYQSIQRFSPQVFTAKLNRMIGLV